MSYPASHSFYSFEAHILYFVEYRINGVGTSGFQIIRLIHVKVSILTSFWYILFGSIPDHLRLSGDRDLRSRERERE